MGMPEPHQFLFLVCGRLLWLAALMMLVVLRLPLGLWLGLWLWLWHCLINGVAAAQLPRRCKTCRCINVLLLLLLLHTFQNCLSMRDISYLSYNLHALLFESPGDQYICIYHTHTHTQAQWGEKERKVARQTCINLMVYKINWRLIFNKTDSYVKWGKRTHKDKHTHTHIHTMCVCVFFCAWRAVNWNENEWNTKTNTHK